MDMINFFKRGIRFLIRPFWRKLCKYFPIKKGRIFVSNFNGNGYSDNLKYIVQALDVHSYDIVWSCKSKTVADSLPNGVNYVLRGTLKEDYYLSTAQVWLDNSRKDIWCKKRAQLYIQTWHGGGGQKKIEKDAESVLADDYATFAKKDSDSTDIYISDSSFMTKLFFRSFWYSGAILEIGYPRYKPLLDAELGKSCRKKIHDFYNIPLDTSIILYAPTFRADGVMVTPILDFHTVLNEFNKKYEKKFVGLVRFHPNVGNDSKNFFMQLHETTIDVTSYPDVQELLASSDILISDYSSIAFDFSLTGKPVFRYLPDYEAYIKDRNLYFDFNEYPYPVAFSNDDWTDIINQFDINQYHTDLNQYWLKLGQNFRINADDICASLIDDYVNGVEKELLIKKYTKLYNPQEE